MRRLTAIMFTDIEGYTALMQENEERAIEFRDRHRKLFELNHKKYHGTILQYYGDGTLSVFDSAIDAVLCGVEMQQAFREFPIVPVRIGIHCGDVIHRDGEIIGDGVNVASRVESLAISGSVLISEKVHDEIKNQQSISTKSLGSFHFKNVKKEMEVFAVDNEGLIVPKPGKFSGKLKAKKSIRSKVIISLLLVILSTSFLIFHQFIKKDDNAGPISVAVLPLRNIGNDPNESYISDGMTEGLMTSLAENGDIHIVSRKSSFKFRNSQQSLNEISTVLKADLIMEGSIRRFGEQFRVDIQLLNPETDRQIWGKSFDKSYSDILVLEKEIASEVYQALGLTTGSKSQSNATDNIEAYNYFLQGRFQKSKLTPQSIRLATELFEKSVSLDSTYAIAYSNLANCYLLQSQVFNQITHLEAWQNAHHAIDKAISIDPDSPQVLWVAAAVKWWYEWDYEGARAYFKKALETDPENSEARTIYGLFLASMSEYEGAINQAEYAIRIDPLALDLQSVMAEILYYSGDFEKSITQCDRILTIDSTYRRAIGIKIWNYNKLDQFEKVFNLFTNAQLKQKSLSIYQEKGKDGYLTYRLDRYLRSTSPNRSMLIARLMAQLDRREEALVYLDEAVKYRDAGLAWIKQFDEFDKLKTDPRFNEILSSSGHSSWQ